MNEITLGVKENLFGLENHYRMVFLPKDLDLEE